MKEPVKAPNETYDYIVSHLSVLRGGHQTCSLPLVRLGYKYVAVHKALWLLEKRIPIPLTHDLYRTCDQQDCVCPDHHELRSKKQQTSEPDVQELRLALTHMKLEVGRLRAELEDTNVRLGLLERSRQ